MQESPRVIKKLRTQAPPPFTALSLIELLPGDVLVQIAQFLNLYEQVGLGQVSQRFRRVIYPAIRYEPFPYDAYKYNGKLWAMIGMRDRFGMSYTSSSFSSSINDLAIDAYKAIGENIERAAGASGRGSGCKLLIDVSQKVQQNGKPFIAVNCVATLKVGHNTVFSVNFKSDCYDDLRDRLRISGIREPDISYDIISHRHAECRFLSKIILTNAGGAVIDVDKLCCVFCAAQFCALGCHDMMPGWKKGKLGWYTFLPVVMFFGNNRRRMWGPEIDDRYKELSLDEKLLLLYHLVLQTQKTDAPTSTTSVPMLGVAPTPSTAVPRCTECGSVKVMRDGPHGKFWGCATFWKHTPKSGTSSLIPAKRGRSVSSTSLAPRMAPSSGVCKKCGGKLVLRDGPHGKFWGCTTFWKHK